MLIFFIYCLDIGNLQLHVCDSAATLLVSVLFKLLSNTILQSADPGAISSGSSPKAPTDTTRLLC